MTKRTNDPDGMRARILDAAFDAFSRRGYVASGLQDIRAAAGVSPGALAHHFASKKALGLAVIRDRVRGAIERTWLRPLAEAETAVQGLEHAFGAIIAELADKQSVDGCPLNNLVIELSGHDGDMRAELAAIFDMWEVAIANRFKADGVPFPAARAKLVVATFSGAIAMSKAAQDAEPLRICWTLMRDQLDAWAAGCPCPPVTERSAPTS